MKNKTSLDILLNLLEEETKKIKKKKKFSPVSILPIRRPMGSVFSMDIGVSLDESVEGLGDLKTQVENSKNLEQFIRDIVTDFDLRYKNRKAAQPLVKIVDINFIDSIKPSQDVQKEVVEDWVEYIEEGKRPFVIITNDKKIDGHHKLEAYRILGFKEIPVLFVKDLIDFYKKTKEVDKYLNESSAIKKITKKFNNLKWELNDFQKQFLDDFINIPEEVLSEKDCKYASNLTGIPLENIKSIRNTYGNAELSYTKEDVVKGSKFDASKRGPIYADFDIEPFYRKDIVNFKSISKEELNYIKKTKKQKKLETSGYDRHGRLVKSFEKTIPEFMYEWLMYFIEGSEILEIKDSNILDRAFANRKTKYVSLEFNPILEESKDTNFDFSSNKKTRDTFEIEKLLKEFNLTFGTNFIIENQFTTKDGIMKIFIENFQTTDGENTYNKDVIKMPSTERVDSKKLLQQFKDMTLNVNSLEVGWNEFLNT